MRPGDADDYSGVTPSVQPPGSLFARPVDDPFERSTVKPTAQELMVAALIWRHKGRGNPLALAKLCDMANLTERQVKDVVQQLRETHHCRIGARRGDPAGYFVIVDAGDLREAFRPYLDQIVAMARTMRAVMTRAEYAEFAGQMRLGEKSEED